MIGATGYGTLTLLRQVKAPTITNSGQSTVAQTKPVASSPAQARSIADAAMTRANDKVASGNQKDALADYQIAYENYLSAGDAHSAKDVEFVITGIKAALAAPTNPGKPKSTETSAKKLN